jgi:hypothetical protein
VCGEGSTMCVVNEQVVLELLNGLNFSDLSRLLELFIDLGHTYLIGSSVANILCCIELQVQL